MEMVTAPPFVLDALRVMFPVGFSFAVPVTVTVQVVLRVTQTGLVSQTTDVMLETTASGAGASAEPA